MALSCKRRSRVRRADLWTNNVTFVTYVQDGPENDTLLVFKLPFLLAASYLQFPFTCTSFSLNDVVLPMSADVNN